MGKEKNTQVRYKQPLTGTVASGSCGDPTFFFSREREGSAILGSLLVHPSADRPSPVASRWPVQTPRGFFIFIFLIFVFYKNIFSFSKFTEIYPTAQLPGGRHLVAPVPGGRDLSVKIFVKKIVFRSLKDRSPGSWAAGP